MQNFYIYKETSKGNQLNGKQVTVNNIFQAVLNGEGNLTNDSSFLSSSFISRQEAVTHVKIRTGLNVRLR